jgi:hypothetical protein
MSKMLVTIGTRGGGLVLVLVEILRLYQDKHKAPSSTSSPPLVPTNPPTLAVDVWFTEW